MPSMFSPVARLRRAFVSLLLASSLVAARDQVLFTSSVTYCEPPESLLIEKFDIAYFAQNQSISFDIIAASVQSNTSVVANLFLNVYGIQPVNVSIDLCSLFGGALCPLPVYTFNATDSLSLPDDLNVHIDIPAIAYIIPDLEAYAQLTLTDVHTGDVRACVQTTLSNGWSTHQYAVEWTTGSIAIFAFALALWQSLQDLPLAILPIRLIDIISLFQSIALSGLLDLNYPSLYISYTLNFAWSLGLFSASTSSSIQQSINRMRHLTGGDLSNASNSSTISFVDRKLSPYNSGAFALFQSLYASGSRALQSDSAVAFSPQLLVSGDVATVTDDSSNVLEPGIPVYTNYIGIATANAFMTVFLVALMLAAIVIGSLAIMYALTVLLSRSEMSRRHPSIERFRARFPSFARAWGLRAAMIAVLPVLVFTFYQWTLKDSWLSVLLSVILLIALMAIILPAVFFAVRSALPTQRWADAEPSSAVMPLIAPYRSNRVYYIIPLLLVTAIKALVTAFGHAHGMVQIIFFVVLEGLLFISIIVLKPFPTRGADVLAGYLSLTRLVCSGLAIAFAESLDVTPIPRVAIGAVSLVIFSVAVLVMFFNLLVNIGLWRLFVYAITCGRRGRKPSAAHTALASHSSDSSIAEKGNGASGGMDEKKDNATVTTGPSQYFFTRPDNPSPPSTASFSPGSPLSATSSTTLGETLPRRWSFQHSRPPSVSTDAPNSPAYTYRTSTASSPISGQRHSRNISSSIPTPLEEHPTQHEPYLHAV